MIKKLLYSIVIIIFIFLVIGFLLPNEVHVERSAEINRPASTVFTLVNSYATNDIWSPWVARDPDAVFQVSGPVSGVGARLEWNGDPRLIGKGSQEIIESKPWSLVRTALDFDQQGSAIAYFDISEREGGCLVTWGFDTDLTEGQGLLPGVMARYFGLLFDRWIGSDYEEGLANLKVFAEAMPNVDFSDLSVEHLEVEPIDVFYIQSVSSQDPDNIASALGTAFQEIMTFMFDNDMEMAGQPMTIARSWDESGYAFDAAIPIAETDVEPAGNILRGQSPSGSAIRVIHRGSYEQMRPAYEKLAAYMSANGLREGPVSWEHYISDPGEVSEENLITNIYFLIEP
jgi:effector-binding domain-containing protein